jgi:hypothetical protein
MSETTVQADLQRELLLLTSVFSAGDVVISDWSILDGSSQKAPFAIIEVSDDFEIDGIQERQWEKITSIPFTLIVRFVNWDVSMLAFRDARQSVIDGLVNVSNYQRASAKLAWGLLSVSSSGTVDPVYDRYNENSAESLPVYLSQRITLRVKEITGD